MTFASAHDPTCGDLTFSRPLELRSKETPTWNISPAGSEWHPRFVCPVRLHWNPFLPSWSPDCEAEHRFSGSSKNSRDSLVSLSIIAPTIQSVRSVRRIPLLHSDPFIKLPVRRTIFFRVQFGHGQYDHFERFDERMAQYLSLCG